MLKNFFLTFSFFKFLQSGMYLDFFIKKLIEVFVINFFSVTSLFFGEKFLIEYLTKKFLDTLIFNLNLNFFFIDLMFSKLFAFFFIIVLIVFSLFLIYIY